MRQSESNARQACLMGDGRARRLSTENDVEKGTESRVYKILDRDGGKKGAAVRAHLIYGE